MDGQNQNPGETSGHSEMNPNQAISLRGSSPAPQSPRSFGVSSNSVAPAADRPAPQPDAQAPQAVILTPPVAAAPVQADATAAPAQPATQAVTTEPAPGPFNAGQSPTPHTVKELTWTASEFIEHPKTQKWYFVMAGVTLAVVLLIFLITRDIFNVVIILIAAGIFGYLASRKPRQLQYALDTKGITIGLHSFPYAEFKGFSIIDEGAFSSINFTPLKRFAPMLSIYYDPIHENQVMDILTQHLPFHEHKRTMVDDLMHRIRF